MDKRKAMRSSVAIIAAHNIVQNTLLNGRGYVAGNIVVGTSLIGLGRAAGLTLSEMGLSPVAKRQDLALAGVVIAMTAGGSLAALSHPNSRALLRDERARDSSRTTIAANTLVRFPFGTALFEETAFRGVLPALVGRSAAQGDLVSACLFGLWHVIPTARVLPGSQMGRDISLRRRLSTIMIGSAATVPGGLALSWLRRRSGSIVVPWLIHSAFNTITYMAGVLAWRIGDRRA